MDEKELVALLKKGDRHAFQRLFKEYQHLVYNVCYRMSGSREDADDAVQDVFLNIYRNMEKFRGEAKVSSWIYRIAVNTCLKKARRRKLENLMSLEFLFREEEGAQPVSPAARPDQDMEGGERERMVQQAIRQLPTRQKTALVLHRYEQLSYEEIAEIMDASISSVESLLHRAKENLTKKVLPLKKYFF